MSVIRDGRNIVAHQKKIRSKKFNELKTILKKYIAELKSISMSIIQKEVENEILEIASEDFETVIKKSLNEYLSELNLAEYTTPLNDFTQLPGYTAAKLSLSELSQLSSAMHKGIHSLTKNHVLESISQSQAYISELTKPLNSFTQLPGYTATQINLAELPKISDLVLDPLNSVSPNLNLKKK